MRLNMNVALQYLEAWLDGTGAAAIYNLMEDAATAEISRAQLWQWINSPNGVLNDGRKVTKEMVHAMLPEEIEKIPARCMARPTSPPARFRRLRKSSNAWSPKSSSKIF